MMNTMMQEAAAAVAANHRMNSRDVLSLVRFALGLTGILAALILVLCH